MPDICLCEKDQDGQCPSCRGTLSRFLGEFVNLFREYQEKMRALTTGGAFSGPACTICVKQSIDFVCANIVTEMAGDVPEDMSRAIVSHLAGTAREFGATVIPATSKAWADLCAKNGWAP